MYLNQIIYPIKTLGPGKRIGIWLAGCNRGCPGCISPELWSVDELTPVSVDVVFNSILRIMESNEVDGITISGGEPMLQADELSELTERLCEYCRDIMVFSGFTYEEVTQDSIKAHVLDSIAVLVDGPYIDALNKQLVLRGSSNQRVILFDEDLEQRYIEYLNKGKSEIQNLHFGDETVSVGIHMKAFTEQLKDKLSSKGIEEEE